MGRGGPALVLGGGGRVRTGQRSAVPGSPVRASQGTERGAAATLTKGTNQIGVESRMGAGALSISSWSRFPSPLIKPGVRISRTGLSDRLRRRVHAVVAATASPGDRAASKTFGSAWGLNRLSPMSPSAASSTARRKSGPFARPALPGFNARMALSDSQCQPPSLPMALVPSSTDTGSPSLTRSAFPACRAPYPGGPSQCVCRWLPGSCCLPRFHGGSASTTSLSRPAQASLTLRPAGLLAHLTVDFVTRLRPAQLPDRAAR